MQSAQRLFKDCGIKITDQGERLFGSVIRTESFREQYIKNKVEIWVKDPQLLSSMHKMTLEQHTQRSPKDYPPDSKWTHFQKTVPDMSEIFERHQRTIDSCSCRTRGKRCRTTNPSSSSQAWWVRPDRFSRDRQNGIQTLSQITDKLPAKIHTQKLNLDYKPSDQLYTRHTKNRIRQEKNAKYQNTCDEILKELTPELQQLIKGAMEKEASFGCQPCQAKRLDMH